MARRYFLSSVLSLTLAAIIAAPVRAEQTPQGIENARNSAIGLINTDGVYVRSGAGDNYYPTTKLNKDKEVTIVGEKFDWLKIVPPQGSFCYVAKAFVDKNPDGTGTVNRDDVNVRAGSELNTIKTTVQAQLSTGQKVKILDEVDEYYKIAPPDDAYLFVKKDFVDFVKQIPSVAEGQKTGPEGSQPQAETDQTSVTQTPDGDDTQATPSGASPENAVAQKPTTQPSSAEADFEKIEADFESASTQNIEQQPLNDLLAGYQKLIANASLPESMRRIADYRVKTIKVRIEARDQFLAVQKQQDEARQKQEALRAEQEEIAQQIKQRDVKIYTAVGTLRTSSLQQGGQMMYRLTDPATGRTVCYLRSDDPKYGTLIGQFIGVKGELTSDPALNLKVVMPQEWAEVDPNQLFRGVGAQVVPPSLLPQASQQASVDEK